MRIGQSTDIHQLKKGRNLILGGVHIPFEYGLEGHSDADVLLHVVAEAILGALGLGDLGTWFPDTDEVNKDLDSQLIVRNIVKKMEEKGYCVGNIDTLVLCQEPKLLPYKEQMCKQIAKLLNIQTTQVNVKATTGEKMGFVGRGEGIMAQAVVLLKENK